MVRLTASPIPIAEVVNALRNPESGAVVAYLGTVRTSVEGRLVRWLKFEVADSVLQKELEEIEAEARRRFELREIFLVHRTGTLMIGEDILLVAISAAHRGPAFDACQYIIERIKELHARWRREE